MRNFVVFSFADRWTRLVTARWIGAKDNEFLRIYSPFRDPHSPLFERYLDRAVVAS